LISELLYLLSNQHARSNQNSDNGKLTWWLLARAGGFCNVLSPIYFLFDIERSSTPRYTETNRKKTYVIQLVDFCNGGLQLPASREYVLLFLVQLRLRLAHFRCNAGIASNSGFEMHLKKVNN
jgi:hypothetical protein